MVPVYGYRSYFIIEEGGTSVIETERRIEEEMSKVLLRIVFCIQMSQHGIKGQYLAVRLLYFFILVSPLF